MNIQELKELIIDNYDPDDVLEALNLSTIDLVNAFEDRLEEYAYKFEEDGLEEYDEEPY